MRLERRKEARALRRKGVGLCKLVRGKSTRLVCARQRGVRLCALWQLGPRAVARRAPARLLEHELVSVLH